MPSRLAKRIAPLVCAAFLGILTACPSPTPTPTAPPASEAPPSQANAPVSLPASVGQDGDPLPGLVEPPASSDAPSDISDAGNLSVACARLGVNGQDFSKPARIQTYNWAPLIPLRDNGDTIVELPNDEAKLVQEVMQRVDAYYRSLAAQGVGIWDGCYGNGQPLMRTVVHMPPQKSEGCGTFYAGWQGTVETGVYMSDEAVTPAAIAHEWTHALVDHLTGMPSDGGPGHQTGALYESLADTFAVLLLDDGSYTVATKTGARARNLADPTASGQAAHWVDYHGDAPDPCGAEKYYEAGIPSKAVHLMLAGGEYPSQPLQADGVTYHTQHVSALGRSKVQLIYFNALDPALIRPTGNAEDRFYTFREFATAVVRSCVALIGKSFEEAGAITRDDCINVRDAFVAVGMLPEPAASAQPTAKSVLWPGRIAYIAAEGDINDVWVVDGAGEARNLTHGTRPAARPAWSPDGKRLLYLLYSPEGNPWRVWLMNDDGSEQREILADFRIYETPQWSHDGTRMFFNSENAIWIADGNGDNPVRLTAAEDIGPNSGEGATDWFPDDRQILFERMVLGSRSEIWIMNSDGTGKRRVSADDVRAYNFTPRLSPDGTKIAYTVREGGDYEHLQVMVMNVDGSEAEQVMPVVRDGREGNLAWSPDGRYLLFTQNMHFDATPGNKWGLYVLELPTRTVSIKTDSVDTVSQPRWSPDGAFIAYSNGAGVCVLRSDAAAGAQGSCIGHTPIRDEVYPAWTGQ